MAVTRIKNNQISDNVITYQKIAAGTLVGSLFSPNLTLNSNVSINGDLTVFGNTTTIGSSDTVVTNPLLILNEAFVGIPSYDVGIIFNRALGTLGTYGGVNAALVWSEAEGAFMTVLTTDTGSTTGIIDKSYKANLSVGNLNVANTITTHGLTVSTINASSFSTSDFSASGNLTVGHGGVINSTRGGFDTVVRGVSDQSLLLVHPSFYDQVAIGGNLTAANIQLGAKLQINSTDSLLIPVGTSAQRPSGVGYTDVDGMIRYNTTINSLEYYGAGQWNTTGTEFTIITSRSYTSVTGDINGNVNGSNTIFTLPSSSTTSGTIVSINGVIQAPYNAYTVSGTTLTLSEAPSVGDLVDVRVLLTTSTVSSLSSPNGLNTVTLSDNGVGLYTGNLSLGSTEAWRVAVNGDFVPVGGNDIGTAEFRVPNIRASRVDIQRGVDLAPAQKYIPPSGSSVIASFDSNIYRSGKFHLQLSDTIGGSYQALEALVVHNGTTASVSYYANVSTSGSELASFSANVFSGNVYVNATSLGANLSVKAGSTLMKI